MNAWKWTGGALALLTLIGGAAMADVVELDGLKSKTPDAWKSSNPSSKLRLFQFAVPKAEGDKEDAELVIFFFGPGSGGGIDENIKRWKSMFEAPEGKSAEELSKVEKSKVGDVDLTYLDQKGIFLSKFPPFAPNAKITKKEDYRRFAVVFESKNGPYFITLTGPAKTMEKHKGDFDSWLKNFK